MAYTQTDLDKIDAAIAGGAKRVRLNGREKEFFSANDLLKLREQIQNDLNRQSASVRRPSAFRARTNKGL